LTVVFGCSLSETFADHRLICSAGPLLLRENYDSVLYWPGKGDEFVTNYYEDAHGNVSAGKKDEEKQHAKDLASDSPDTSLRDIKDADGTLNPNDEHVLAAAENTPAMQKHKKAYVPPYERFVGPTKSMSWINPLKWWGWFKFVLLRGVTMDVLTHDSAALRDIHARAHR